MGERCSVTGNDDEPSPYWGSTTCEGVVDDKEILELLYSETKGDNWNNNEGWDPSSDPCRAHAAPYRVFDVRPEPYEAEAVNATPWWLTRAPGAAGGRRACAGSEGGHVSRRGPPPRGGGVACGNCGKSLCSTAPHHVPTANAPATRITTLSALQQLQLERGLGWLEIRP